MLIKQPERRGGRIIFHFDMNCFYASVEMAYHPELKGKPLAIAGNPEERKGVIVTSSYEARAKGVKTTMPLWQARRLCPELIVRRPNFDRYRQASKDIFTFLAEITPMIEPVSIDEGYMDVTDVKQHPVELARYIQKQLKKTLDLPCSIGIAPNKFLAKTASDMEKPMGLTILRRRELSQMLWPLPIEEMHGVGEKTKEKLNALDIHTIGELAQKDVYVLKQALGVNGERLKNRANGIDPREVDPDSVYDFKSIGSSQTLSRDTTDETEIRRLMHFLAENVERRLNRKEAAGSSVQLMIRYHDRKTVTRSRKLPSFIDTKEEILVIANDLWQTHWNMEPIRLLGITVQDIEEKKHIAHQLDLFTYEEEASKEKLDTVIQELSDRFGEDVFQNWVKPKEEDEEHPRTSFQKDFLDDYRK